MDISIKEIKRNARKSLKGKWHLMILITILYSITGLVWNLIPDIMNNWNSTFDIINIVVDSLLIFGYMNIVLDVSRRKFIDISLLLKGCTKFFKALGIKILMFVFITLWSLLFVIPGFIAAISYSMTFYIWVDNPEIGIKEAITRSKELTEGHKLEIFALLFSFMGWILLALIPACIIKGYFPQFFNFTLTLGMIIVEPYIAVSLADFYNKLIDEKAKEETSYFV
ncbi:DUF975 family protein [Clostridium sp. SM-530-WT-3G]|uniref:DUF975 family protein n=1 Tax=Clostridium sp. SM-530-WT-3G TaxID=2725303 RepID=UPI00145C79E9|nr:DUF975 family protein [Clostridium sp. SM-530-WT-3G]NME82040.1 DUF975 family protein [Clostridium sp. SM-530-WT-3G]